MNVNAAPATRLKVLETAKSIVTKFNKTRFEDYLRLRRIKPETIYRYCCLIEKVLNNVLPLTPENLDTWLVNRKICGSTRREYGHATRIYGRCIGDPSLEKIKLFAKNRVNKQTINIEDIKNILSLPRPAWFQKKPWDNWTNFFTLLAGTGMRPKEVATLRVADINFSQNSINLNETKTGWPRLVPIRPEFVDLLHTLVACSKNGYLFSTANGGRPNRVTWGRAFNYRLKILGIQRKGVTLYSLRHSLATRFIEEGVPLPIVQRILGHRKLDTTSQYLHMTTRDTTEAMRKDPLYQSAKNDTRAFISCPHCGMNIYFTKRGE